MLTVKFYKPKEEIRWFVRKLETIKTIGLNAQMGDFFIPRPDISLVFHFGNLPTILLPEKKQLKPIFLAPIHTKPCQIQIDGMLDTFIVICNASVLSRVLGLNLTGEAKDYIAVSDSRIVAIYNDLAGLLSDEERINCFSEHAGQFVADSYQPDLIDTIYCDILRNNMHKSLETIISNASCSISSLQRNFLRRTGVSMKKLIRIARVNSIFEKMLEENEFNYNNILFESNYYDQSHFIKDFKQLTGKNPSTFFKQNSDLCKILSGMHNSKDFLEC